MTTVLTFQANLSDRKQPLPSNTQKDMSLASWALPQISRLLPLDDDSLKQIIAYTETLSKPAAAEHLKNLLGDSAQALEFISSFNNRRPNPQTEPASITSTPSTSARDPPSEVPKAARRPAKAKKPLHALPARQVEHHGDIAGAYQKRDEADYMAARPARKEPPLANTLALQDKPDALQVPLLSTHTASSSSQQSHRLPPSAAGALISDMPSAKSSRSSSPATRAPQAKTKVSIAGGAAMRGQSTVLSDLDSAIRSLELQTNPSLSALTPQENARRRCDCMAQKHPLLTAAPNCTNCGKIICAKEGLGPCTFCEKPLLSSSELQAMLRSLKDERGRERQAAHNAAHTRPEISKAPRPFSPAAGSLSTPGMTPPALTTSNTPISSAPSSDDESSNLARAKAHRDRLLAFQAQNARRTQIHDEAADFETPDAGTSMWASPQERALQLKRQQKILREQEWNARPEYEKRKMVVSIDIKGGKAVRTMRPVETPDFDAMHADESDVGADDYDDVLPGKSDERSKGTFSRNPLLGGLIRPVYNKAEGAEVGKGKGPVEAKETRKQQTGWRRVQMDGDEDNEAWILDGGAYGGGNADRVLGAEEHAVGSGAAGGASGGYKSQVG